MLGISEEAFRCPGPRDDLFFGDNHGYLGSYDFRQRQSMRHCTLRQLGPICWNENMPVHPPLPKHGAASRRLMARTIAMLPPLCFAKWDRYFTFRDSSQCPFTMPSSTEMTWYRCPPSIPLRKLSRSRMPCRSISARTVAPK